MLFRSLRINKTRAALVPFTLDGFKELAGVSVDAVVSCGSARFHENILFTHRGLSGPAILQISSYWKQGTAIHIDLAPEKNITAEIIEPNAQRTLSSLRSALRKHLPARLADRWLELHPPADFTNQSLRDFERQLHEWKITKSGTEGYSKAEVTAGGVDTDELSAKTMQCKKVPGLFFIGEVVDVTGHLGGFNFQWAWASGYCAGQAV